MRGVRTCTTEGLSSGDLSSIRALMDAAFDGDFGDDDWAHSLGGAHALIDDRGVVVAHACVVPRTVRVEGVGPLHAGYVEAVAVAPECQASGFGSAVMHAGADRGGGRRDHGAHRAGRPTGRRSRSDRVPRPHW
jgi:aminoglycoside 2'-N-acetyltransferase I